MIYYKDWPNKVRKIWWGDNEFGFWEAQEETNKLGFELRFDEEWQPYIVKIS